MNLFDDTLRKNHLENLPDHYKVSKNKKVMIRVSHISEFSYNNQSYTYNIYNTDFNNRIEFEELLFKKFKQVDYIISIQQNMSSMYHLKNGLLHNAYSWAIKHENPIITEYSYYIQGGKYTEDKFIKIIRTNKMKNILCFVY